MELHKSYSDTARCHISDGSRQPRLLCKQMHWTPKC